MPGTLLGARSPLACPHFSFTMIKRVRCEVGAGRRERVRMMSETPDATPSTEIPSARGEGVIHGRGGIWVRLANELTGRYGFVLALILLDYIALSLLSGET